MHQLFVSLAPVGSGILGLKVHDLIQFSLVAMGLFNSI